MTHLTEPLSPPMHRRVLQRARAVCDEACRDRRAVSGAVAALGVGLMLGLFLKPTVADSDPNRSTASGVAFVEPGLVRTEGVDILVTARTSPEGRVPRVYTRLEAPVFGDPGPAPRLRRVTHVVEPDSTVFADEPDGSDFDDPPVDSCVEGCDEPGYEPFPELEPL